MRSLTSGQLLFMILLCLPYDETWRQRALPAAALEVTVSQPSVQSTLP